VHVVADDTATEVFESGVEFAQSSMLRDQIVCGFYARIVESLVVRLPLAPRTRANGQPTIEGKSTAHGWAQMPPHGACSPSLLRPVVYDGDRQIVKVGLSLLYSCRQSRGNRGIVGIVAHRTIIKAGSRADVQIRGNLG
jgi:hypothetical protein